MVLEQFFKKERKKERKNKDKEKQMESGKDFQINGS